MPATKSPCVQCRGDEQKPRCQRCQTKHLPCTRPAKKTVFRHQSAAGFSKDQKWVNSQPKQSSPPGDQGQSAGSTSLSFPPSPRGQELTSAPTRDDSTSAHTPGSGAESTHDGSWRPQKNHVESGPSLNPLHHDPQPSLWKQTVVQTETQPSLHRWPSDQDDRASHWYGSSAAPSRSSSHPGGYCQSGFCRFPLEDVQEACLMAYFVEEISHWFDLCDEDRHFQMVVPVRAREHPHLLNAIFAVAARHLSRLPQYKTPRGIVYRGQLLPNLSPHTAVEYMLRCIPALRHFHDAEDDGYRDSIIATAVILRQLEEIDDDDDHDEEAGGRDVNGDGPMQTQVNFLPIIDTVLRSPLSQSGFAKRSLIQAAYWMALRQEIYHSFMRAQPPQMILTADYWQGASRANKAVMHTVQVAKWRFGSTPEEEWGRLVKQHEHLETDVLADFQPIFYREPDKTKGEIFPTVWYGSNIEVTSIQQAIIAKAILTAENPYLNSGAASRAEWRVAETQVRALVLELCGIALCHPSSPPALLKAMFGIQLYGDFFTDQWERNAIRGVVERYRDARAWPSRRLMEMFE